VGYRWYDQQHQTPLYPFGYGLSYTRFAYSGLTWQSAREPAGRRAVRQRGARHLHPDHAPPRPVQARVVHVPLRQLRYWDTAASSWHTAAGQRPLYVAANERSTDLTTTITVNG
jgi:beta-glucosidase